MYVYIIGYHNKLNVASVKQYEKLYICHDLNNSDTISILYIKICKKKHFNTSLYMRIVYDRSYVYGGGDIVV